MFDVHWGKKNVYSAITGGSFLEMILRSSYLVVLFLYILTNLFLSISGKELLNCWSKIVDLCLACFAQ